MFCEFCATAFVRRRPQGSVQRFCSAKCREAAKRAKPRHKAYLRNYFQNNKPASYRSTFNYRASLRDAMVAAYGGACVACGEADPIVLVLDHVRDNAPERKRWGKREGGYKLYLMLRDEGWPQADYQLLCHNCNYRKEHMRRQNAAQARFLP